MSGLGGPECLPETALIRDIDDAATRQAGESQRTLFVLPSTASGGIVFESWSVVLATRCASEPRPRTRVEQRSIAGSPRERSDPLDDPSGCSRRLPQAARFGLPFGQVEIVILGPKSVRSTDARLFKQARSARRQSKPSPSPWVIGCFCLNGVCCECWKYPVSDAPCPNFYRLAQSHAPPMIR